MKQILDIFSLHWYCMTFHVSHYDTHISLLNWRFQLYTDVKCIYFSLFIKQLTETNRKCLFVPIYPQYKHCLYLLTTYPLIYSGSRQYIDPFEYSLRALLHAVCLTLFWFHQYESSKSNKHNQHGLDKAKHGII